MTVQPAAARWTVSSRLGFIPNTHWQLGRTIDVPLGGTISRYAPTGFNSGILHVLASALVTYFTAINCDFKYCSGLGARARAQGILVLAIYNQLISVTQGHFRFARARFTHARRLLLDSPPPCGCPPRTCAGCPTPSSLHSPTGRSSLSALDANIPASFLCFETSTWELRAGRPRPAAR